MSKISDKLNIISSAKDDIKTAIENKGVSVGDVGIQDYASKIGEITGSEVYPTLQEKTVIPTNETQEVIPDEGIYGLSKVVVNGDDNLISENIIQGKIIFGVEGTAETGGGGTPVEKGVVINAYDKNGYPIDVEVVGLTSIPNYYFVGYQSGVGVFKNLKSIKLPNNLTTLNNACFKNLNMLESINLPETLTTLATNCFENCSKLKITSIPSGVTRIPRYSFYYCQSITELTFYGAVTSFIEACFSQCSNLSKIIIPNITTIPTLDASALNGTPIARGTGYIYVPDDLIDSFKSATNWSAYADQIKGVSELV